jgi:hypothetical protein
VWPLENGDREKNRTWLTWDHPDWGIPKTLLPQATMPRDLNCSQGFCNLGLELTISTGFTSSHFAASAVMNSGCHPEHTTSRFDNSRQARQQWGYMESQSPVDLTTLVLYPTAYVHQGNECSMKLPCLSCVSQGSYFYEFWHKAIFLSKKSTWYEIILWLTEFKAFILLPEINTYNYFLFFQNYTFLWKLQH